MIFSNRKKLSKLIAGLGQASNLISNVVIVIDLLMVVCCQESYSGWWPIS
ncbi:MAG: hypothetical protein PHU81_02650 [Acidobacteriota bacterium]|nr:hypothetical protein [Acidobacteriota bacterium]